MATQDKLEQLKNSKFSAVSGGLLGVVFLIVVYLLAVGLVSSPSTTPYKPQTLEASATDQERAAVIARGVTSALDQSLSTFFGWLPNDLLAPWVLDNTTS